MRIQNIIQEFVQWLLDDFAEGISEAIDEILTLAWKIIKAIFLFVLAVGTIELWIIPFIYWLFCCRNNGEE